MTSAGLRETKKAATRQALAAAVLRLSARDGFDTVSVERVAAEVGVSPRTFHNYFTGREEALRFYLTELIDTIFTVMEARPADEDLWDATAAAFIEIICDGDTNPYEFIHLMTVMDSEPSLAMQKPSPVNQSDPVTQRFAAMCQRRTLGPDGVDHARLVLGCAAICVRVALETEALQAKAATPSPELRATLQRTFDKIRNGLGNPGTCCPNSNDTSGHRRPRSHPTTTRTT